MGAFASFPLAWCPLTEEKLTLGISATDCPVCIPLQDPFLSSLHQCWGTRWVYSEALLLNYLRYPLTTLLTLSHWVVEWTRPTIFWASSQLKGPTDTVGQTSSWLEYRDTSQWQCRKPSFFPSSPSCIYRRNCQRTRHSGDQHLHHLWYYPSKGQTWPEQNSFVRAGVANLFFWGIWVP